MRRLFQLSCFPLSCFTLSCGMGLAGLAALVAAGPALAQAADAPIPPGVVKAVADANRPAADRARDAARKPAEIVAFSGLAQGQTIADLLPGEGYYDRIFSDVVGPSGRVYSFYATQMKNGDVKAGGKPFPGYDNATALLAPIEQFAVPEKLDIVWISDNYHDLHDPVFGPADMAKVDKAVYDALKPGGVFLLLDHAAEAGSGLRDTNTRHRIDEESAKQEVEAVGFKLVGESQALRNPADTHQLRIFDPAIRGKTDQFVLKFQKPKG